MFAALADGVRFARTTPAMRRMVVVMIAVVFVGAPFIALVPQIATNVFGGGEASTSILVTCQGIGAVAAAVTLGSVTSRLGSWRVLVVSSFAFCAALVLYGSAPVFAVAAFGLVMVGLTYGFAFTSFAGIAQLVAPDEMRGRVLAVNSFVLGTMYPLGLLVQGVIADATSLRLVTAGSGVVLAVLLVILGTHRPDALALAAAPDDTV